MRKPKKVKIPALKPFQATYYNSEKITDLSKVVCPPYDLIDKKTASFLKKQSPYNFCRINLADGNDYNKPAKNFKNWLKKGIFLEDPCQSYYLYQQDFKFGKKRLSSYGIFCLLNMEKKDIFPHESTLRKAKEDRKKIIAKVKANLSPIFVIAKGADSFFSEIIKKQTKAKPFFAFKGRDGIVNRAWKISDKKDISLITSGLEDACLVIADGHHRFETSFLYFQKNKANFTDLNYILAYLSFPQPGLAILPTHRIISLKTKCRDNLNRLEKEFNLQLLSQEKLEKKLKLTKQFCFGIYLKKKFFFLTLKDNRILDKIFPEAYRSLDSYIFHEIVLPKIAYKKIEYSHSINQAKKITGGNKMAFLLRAAPLDSIFNVAKAGYKLPQKSTYFYPKVLSGLVLRRFKK